MEMRFFWLLNSLLLVGFVSGYNTGPALVKQGLDVAMPSYSTTTTYFRADHGLGLNLAASTSTLYFTANDAIIRSSTSYLKLQTSAGANYAYIYSDGSNGVYLKAPAPTSTFQATTTGGFNFNNFASDVLFLPSTSNFPTMRFTDNSLTNIRFQTLTGVNSGYMTICYNGYYNAGEFVDVAGKTRVRIGLDIRGGANLFFMDQYFNASINGQFLKVDFTVGNYVQFPYGILSNSIITSAATDLSLNPAGTNVNFNSKTLTNIGSVYGNVAVTPITTGGAALQQSLVYVSDASTTTLAINCMSSTNNYGACLLGWNGQYGSSATNFVRTTTSRRMWMWNTPAAATTLDQFNLQSYDGTTTRTHMQLDTAVGNYVSFPNGLATATPGYMLKNHGWSGYAPALADTVTSAQSPAWSTIDGSLTIPGNTLVVGSVIEMQATLAWTVVGASPVSCFFTPVLGTPGLNTLASVNTTYSSAGTRYGTLKLFMVITAVGSTGNFIANLQYQDSTGYTVVSYNNNFAGPSLNLAGSSTLDIRLTFGQSGTTSSVTFYTVVWKVY